VKAALVAIQSKDVAAAKDADQLAVRKLSKAASKGAIPRNRAARKISRITHFVKKSLPALFQTQK
jgi:ribosomal protein S20